MKRPSPREIHGKLKQAQEAATEKRIAFVEPGAIYSDLLDLNLSMEELAERLPLILAEMRPGDYRGRRPPDKSYERSTLLCELFASRWSSKLLGCRMYLKFAFKDGMLWMVSFHQHRT